MPKKSKKPKQPYFSSSSSLHDERNCLCCSFKPKFAHEESCQDDQLFYRLHARYSDALTIVFETLMKRPIYSCILKQLKIDNIFSGDQETSTNDFQLESTKNVRSVMLEYDTRIRTMLNGFSNRKLTQKDRVDNCQALVDQMQLVCDAMYEEQLFDVHEFMSACLKEMKEFVKTMFANIDNDKVIRKMRRLFYRTMDRANLTIPNEYKSPRPIDPERDYPSSGEQREFNQAKLLIEQLLLNRAHVAVRLMQYDDALADCNAVLSIDDRNSIALWTRAAVHALAGRLAACDKDRRKLGRFSVELAGLVKGLAQSKREKSDYMQLAFECLPTLQDISITMQGTFPTEALPHWSTLCDQIFALHSRAYGDPSVTPRVRNQQLPWFDVREHEHKFKQDKIKRALSEPAKIDDDDESGSDSFDMADGSEDVEADNAAGIDRDALVHYERVYDGISCKLPLFGTRLYDRHREKITRASRAPSTVVVEPTNAHSQHSLQLMDLPDSLLQTKLAMQRATAVQVDFK